MYLSRNNRVKFFTKSPGPMPGPAEHMFDEEARNKKTGKSASTLAPLLPTAECWRSHCPLWARPLLCKVSDLMARRACTLSIGVCFLCHRALPHGAYLWHFIRLSPFLYCIYIIARFWCPVNNFLKKSCTEIRTRRPGKRKGFMQPFSDNLHKIC